MSVGGSGPVSGGNVWGDRPVDEAGADAGGEAAPAPAPTRAPPGNIRNAFDNLFRGIRLPTPPTIDLSRDVLDKLPPAMRRMLDKLGPLPMVGEIGDSTGVAKPAVVNSPEFGRSSALPMILEVPVASEKIGMLEVGKKVHDKFFPDAPPFNFNVNFSCANATGLSRESEYTDPRSPWFNVFFGRYQIDAPTGAPGEAGKWDRPFGFVRPGSNEINFDDLLKIGKADWGYFSNWMYGVPEADLDRIFKDANVGRTPTCTVTNPSVTINGKEYVECTVDGVMLPSAYVSGKDGKGLTNNDPLMSNVWRNVFGKQNDAVNKDPRLAGLESFTPTEMKMKFYLRQEKRWDPELNSYAYSTQIYGGGINKTWAGNDPAKQAHNERFLEAQMDAVKATMPPP